MEIKKKLSVLLITPQLSVGGAERQVVILANELKKRNHKVTILSSGGIFELELMNNDITSLMAPVQNKDLLSFVRTTRIIRNTIKKFDVDIIHCHAAIPTLAARLASVGKGIPIVCTGHGWEQSKFNLIAPLLSISSDRVIAISEKMRHSMISGGATSNKIEVIYNAVDKSPLLDTTGGFKKELGLSTSHILLGMVSRISVPFKGHSLLIKAMAELVKEFPYLRLAIIGDGKFRHQYEMQVENENLNEYIFFTGNRTNMSYVYSGIDILVLPSLREGLPVVVLEAMAAGKAVIATDVGGTSEIIMQGESGLLIKANDIVDLRESIKSLIVEPRKIYEMGNRGRSIVSDKFSVERFVLKTENLYLSLL